MSKLTIEQKSSLLLLPIWKKKDAINYFEFSQAKMGTIFKKLKEPENFKKCIYRDDLFKELGTSVEKEASILSKLNREK